jgi:hypothetical protein
MKKLVSLVIVTMMITAAIAGVAQAVPAMATTVATPSGPVSIWVDINPVAIGKTSARIATWRFRVSGLRAGTITSDQNVAVSATFKNSGEKVARIVAKGDTWRDYAIVVPRADKLVGAHTNVMLPYLYGGIKLNLTSVKPYQLLTVRVPGSQLGTKVTTSARWYFYLTGLRTGSVGGRLFAHFNRAGTIAVSPYLSGSSYRRFRALLRSGDTLESAKATVWVPYLYTGPRLRLDHINLIY